MKHIFHISLQYQSLYACCSILKLPEQTFKFSKLHRDKKITATVNYSYYAINVIQQLQILLQRAPAKKNNKLIWQKSCESNAMVSCKVLCRSIKNVKALMSRRLLCHVDQTVYLNHQDKTLSNCLMIDSIIDLMPNRYLKSKMDWRFMLSPTDPTPNANTFATE